MILSLSGVMLIVLIFLFLGCVLILNVDCLVKCFGKFVWCGG